MKVLEIHSITLASTILPISSSMSIFPIQTLKVGAPGTYNMLGLSKEQNAHFLLAFTLDIYGDPLVNPQPVIYWAM